MNIQKAMWGLINSEVRTKGRKKGNNITLIEGTKNVFNSKIIANMLVEHFVNIIKDQNVNCYG